MKELWEMRRDEFDPSAQASGQGLAALPDKQLGKLYHGWKVMYGAGVHANDEELAAYAFLARRVLQRPGSEEAGEFARFARIRLASTALGYGLASAESAYKTGKDYLDFHYLVVQRALSNGYPVPPDVLADYADLAPADQPAAPPSGPLLSNGKPHAPLPEALVAKLKPRHVLIYQAPPDSSRPFYSDGIFIIYGSWPDYWVAHWLSRPPDTMPSIHLWEGKLNLDLVRASTPQACADALRGPLAAWGHPVEITLADGPVLPDSHPRAPLPLTLYQHLRASHTLVYHPDDEHPCYRDDVLTVVNTGDLFDEWDWVMYYLGAKSGPLPLDLWRGESGFYLIGASTAEGCLAEFQAQLAAWGRQVEIALHTPAAKAPAARAAQATPARLPHNKQRRKAKQPQLPLM